MLIIVSEDYPGYGGYGTYAYNLFQVLKQNLGSDYPVSLIYCLQSESYRSRIDPLNLGRVWGFTSLQIPNQNLCKCDLIISMTPWALKWSLTYLKSQNHWYRMGMIPLSRFGILYNLWAMTPQNIEAINSEDYLILKTNPGIKIIPNSPLMELAVKTIGRQPHLNLQNEVFPNLIGLSYDLKQMATPTKSKIYDFIFVTSNVNRYEKNFSLLTQIYEKFPEAKKIIIGHNVTQNPWVKNSMSVTRNLQIFEFLDNAQVQDLMSQTRILILPSIIDAGPSVVLEAILHHCQPMVSINSGFANLFPNSQVAQVGGDNILEWTQKLTNLLQNNLNTNQEIITKMKQDQINFQTLIENLIHIK